MTFERAIIILLGGAMLLMLVEPWMPEIVLWFRS